MSRSLTLAALGLLWPARHHSNPLTRAAVRELIHHLIRSYTA